MVSRIFTAWRIGYRGSGENDLSRLRRRPVREGYAFLPLLWQGIDRSELREDRGANFGRQKGTCGDEGCSQEDSGACHGYAADFVSFIGNAYFFGCPGQNKRGTRASRHEPAVFCNEEGL